MRPLQLTAADAIKYGHKLPHPRRCGEIICGAGCGSILPVTIQEKIVLVIGTNMALVTEHTGGYVEIRIFDQQHRKRLSGYHQGKSRSNSWDTFQNTMANAPV